MTIQTFKDAQNLVKRIKECEDFLIPEKNLSYVALMLDSVRFLDSLSKKTNTIVEQEVKDFIDRISYHIEDCKCELQEELEKL